MISTGFSALDNCIGGLKKGKLYTLAGFNFTPPVFQQGKIVAEFEVCSQVEADISPGKDK